MVSFGFNSQMQICHDDSGWCYEISTFQGFYMFGENLVTIDGEVIEPTDVIGAFKDGVCVGWTLAESGGGVMTLPAMGNDGSYPGYLQAGDVPEIRVFDSSSGLDLDTELSDIAECNNPDFGTAEECSDAGFIWSEPIPGWENAGIYVLDGNAPDGLPAVDIWSCTSGIENLDECRVCDGPGEETWYDDSDGDGWGCNPLGDGCAADAGEGWVNNGDDADCDLYCETNVFDQCGVCDGEDLCVGCTDPDAMNYEDDNTISDGSCLPNQINGLTATEAGLGLGGIISLSWNADLSANLYNIYEDDSLLASIPETSYSHVGLLPSSEHSYTVSATHSDGNEGENSDSVIATTAGLSGATLDSVAIGQGKLIIHWSTLTEENSYNGSVYSFDIYKDDSLAIHKSSGSRQWTDTDVVPGESYCYSVNAINDEYGLAPASDVLCGIPDEFAGWGINITAEVNGYGLFLESDDYNYLGVDANASDGFDTGGLDVPEPFTPPGNWVSFYFPHPEWLALYEDYTQDVRFMRDLSDELMIWDAEVISNMSGDAVITFDFVADAGGYPVYALINDEFILINNGSSIGYLSTEYEIQEVTIIVGNITPQAPTGLIAEQDDNDGTHILLNWNPSEPCCGSIESRYPPSDYYIYRMIRNVDDEGTIPDESLTYSPVYLDQVPANETTFLDDRLNELTENGRYIYETYFSYMITSVNHGYGFDELVSGETGLESEYSNEAGATTMFNADPICDAGSDEMYSIMHDGLHLDVDNPDGVEITIDGSNSSDPEYGFELDYTWTQSSGPSIDLDDPSSMITTFLAINPNGGDTQTYEFNLLVTDNYWIGEPPTLSSHYAEGTVTITVEPEPNNVPISDIDVILAGDNPCDLPEWECDNDTSFPIDDFTPPGEDGPRWQVPHDGTAETNLATIGYVGFGSSDPDGDVLEFLWDTGSPAEPFDDANGNGVYDWGEPFFDVNGDGIWNDGDPYVAQNIVVERGPGIHTFELTVEDPYGADHTSDIVIIVHEEPNSPPVSKAGIDQNLFLDAYSSTHEVTLPMVWTDDPDSDNDTDYLNLSFDPDGHYLTGEMDSLYYTWNPNGETTPLVTLNLPLGEHAFELEVCDSYGACDIDSVIVTILPEPAPDTPVGLGLDPWLYYINVSFDSIGVANCDDREDPYDEHCYTGYVDHYIVYRDGSFLTTVDANSPTIINEFSGNPGHIVIDNGLDTDTEYCYFVVAVNTHGLAGYQSETECIFTGIPPTIQVDSPNGAEIYTNDQDFDISWSITDGQYHEWNIWGDLVIEQSDKHFIDLIEVYYSENDGEDWSVIFDSDVPTDETTTLSLSGSLTINYDARIKVQIRDTGDASDNEEIFTLYDDESDDNFTLSAETLSQGFSEGWSLFGTPLELPEDNNSMVDNLGAEFNFGPLGEYWYVYDQYGSYPSGPEDTEYELLHGTGYILTLAQNSSLTLNGDIIDIADPSTESHTLSLNSGWNLLSNPLVAIIDKEELKIHTNNSDYPWEDAVNFGFIQGSVNGWSNSDALYYPSDQFEPWEGYWVHASRDLEFKFNPHNHNDDDLSRDLTDLWALNIYARGINDGSSGDFVSVGLSETAAENFRYGEDEYDLPDPLGFKFINLYFNRTDWLLDELVDVNDVEIEASEFYRDIRPYLSPDVEQVWQISSYINNMNPEDNIEISWNNYDAISLGEDYDIYFILNGQVYDMKQTSSVIVNNISDSQIFVQIGGSPLSNNQIGVPDKFKVSAAYPNPFNPVTNVDFAIPEAGNVSIKVYNLVGQVMETLVDDYKSAGFHTVSWDASSVPSGLYFITVESGEKVSTQKLVLMK